MHKGFFSTEALLVFVAITILISGLPTGTKITAEENIIQKKAHDLFIVWEIENASPAQMDEEINNVFEKYQLKINNEIISEKDYSKEKMVFSNEIFIQKKLTEIEIIVYK
ncbi:MAG: hypothetical protein COV47_02205 [Candidatus Diapherotrites archaeon CG11_big_fil_rev_8_21_14_0_20_37_9]|nr:MAG: hypothetical protein COV47_02205 [Candidatus Diapherotrites archaeon CG11_big_fil_rev_8_21_14_0_20_37_9]